MAKKNKTTKTTEVINLTITKIANGDTSELVYNQAYAMRYADIIKNLLGVDNVVVDSVQAFVMEE